MKGGNRVIFWFSGSGNSCYAAETLASKTGDDAGCMVNFANSLPPLKNGESLGFVFPVYFYRVPAFVEAFVRSVKMACPPETYVYAVITCGGSIGDAGERFRALLKENGVPLTALFAVRMPDNYILLYDSLPPEKQALRLAQADAALETIAERIRGREKYDEKRLRGHFPRALTAIAAPLYEPARRTAGFFADDRCVGCGKCAQICPERAIEIRQGRPVWVNDKCSLCLGCMHRCPKMAIQKGAKTASRRRYVHPESGF